MGTVIVDLSGDESRLARAYDIAEKKDKSLRDSLAATGKVGQSANEQVIRSLDQTGDKGTKAMNLVLKELRKLGPEGKEAARAVEGRLREAGTHGRKSMDWIVSKLGEIDPAAAEAAQGAIEQFTQMSEVVEAKLIKAATPFDMLKKKASDMFGPGGIESIKGYAVAIGGVTAALQLAGAGFELLKEKQAAALGSLQSQESSEKRLAQIATSADDLDAMIAQADKISLQTGMDRERSRGLIFSARSEGFSEDVGQIARFGQVVDVESQGSLAGSLGRLFKGEGLSVEQRLSGVLAAAEQSAFDFETVGRSVKKSAAPASASGADLAETLAANATLANLIGESAGDRLKAFTSKAALSPDLQGQGIIGSVEALQQMPEEDRKKFLGESIELNEAYKLLSDNLPEVAKITAAVRKDLESSASGEGVLAKRTEIVEGSDRFQDRMNVARSEIAKQIAEESRFASGGASIKEAENLVDANLANAGISVTGQAALQSLSTGDIPLIGGFLPDVSTQDAAVYGGSMLGVDPTVTAGALAMTASANENSQLPWYMKMLPGTSGVSSALTANQVANDSRLADELKEQTGIMRQQLEMEQQRQQRPTAPPVNYGAGLQPAANEASRP